MTLKRALEILELHQQWRLGTIDEMTYTTAELTEAINIAIKTVKDMYFVVDSFDRANLN